MKPVRILIFFVSVFGLLLLLSLVFPKDGIIIGKNIELNFMDVGSFFEKDSSPVNIVTAGLVNMNAVSDDPEFGDIDSVLIMRDTVPDVNNDSIIKAKIDSITKAIPAIEFSEEGRDRLHKFFKRADQAKAGNKPLRILHYGDSQLENDRMTSLLRYRLQKVFGGSGCGLVPAVPLYYGNPTFKEKVEGDWIRYTGFGQRDSTLTHRTFGAMNCYTEVPSDSTGEEVSLSFDFLKGRRASQFTGMKIYLHADSDSGEISVLVNDTIEADLHVYAGFQMVEYKPEVKVGSLKIDFKLEDGGRIYGISFDSDAGIQMDNMAMRGSSGLEFRRQDTSYLKYMLQDLNVGLFIMQFGGNTVPYIKKTGFYRSSFTKELNYIKELCPDAAIIVVGPSDMSRKENGRFITWESVEPVRDALRDAAIDAGCAFWDMYEAMGGYNSMHAFAQADPPLAQKDYVHFTPRGANMMAGMFCSSLMLEYSRYKSAIPRSPRSPRSPSPQVPQSPQPLPAP